MSLLTSVELCRQLKKSVNSSFLNTYTHLYKLNTVSQAMTTDMQDLTFQYVRVNCKGVGRVVSPGQ